MAHLTPTEWVVRQFGSRAEVVRQLGVDNSRLTRWLRAGSDSGRRGAGDIPPPQCRRLLEIARNRGLDITADDLLYGRDVPGPSATPESARLARV